MMKHKKTQVGREGVAIENAVIYARFSSDKQNEESIDAQVRACREYAAGHGLNVLEVYADAPVIIGLKTLRREKCWKRGAF